MAQIRIRIGAVKDKSVDKVFTDIEDRARKSALIISRAMRDSISQGLGKGGAGGGGGGRGGRVGASPEEREAKRIADAKIREERRVAREQERLARWRQNLQNRHFNEVAREHTRQARREEREALRTRRQLAERTSHRTTRFLTPNAPIGSMATRALGDFARGAGVDFSIAGSVARVVGLEAQATALSNSGYQRGKAGPNGQRVDPRALVQQARGVGEKYGLNASDALEGLAQFQKITGDLATGRSMLDGMAKLSAATGTNLSDMAAAAANVSNGLGDIPNKAGVIDTVMRTIAGQGKLGAVEVSDLATQMARVAASAGQFTGDKAQNILKMSALAQIARSTGGAPSAAEAARSTVGFANTLKKSARINEFKAHGIDVFADKGKTEFKDPFQLIRESLVQTKGNLQEMNKLFMDVVGARGVAGLSKTYSDAGGGKAGLDAVEKEFEKFMKGAALSQQEIDESAARAAETAAAKAARFQNRLDQIVEKIAEKVIPALDELAPKFLQFADMLGKIASWALENPYQAILVATTTAITRALGESLLRTGIDKLVMGAPGLPGTTGPGGYNRNAGFGGGMGVAGNAVAALTVAALAVQAFYVGRAIIDELIDNSRAERNAEMLADVSNETLNGQVAELLRKGDLKGAADLQKKKVEQDKADVAATEAQLNPGVWQSIFEKLISWDPTGTDTMIAQPAQEAFAARDEANKRALDAQRDELAKSTKVLEQILIAVQNQGGGSNLLTPGRQPTPMPGQ